MTVIANNSSNSFYRNACIVMIWCITAYASIIQYRYFQIPNGMLLFGAVILVFYVLENNGKVEFHEALTDENLRLLYFMAYMLVFGFLASPNRGGHVSQWITCMEYLFLQIVIASIIKSSGTDTFHTLLLAETAVLAVIFIRNPVEYGETGRYSISVDINPNGLGMLFVAGIWAVLYKQQKSRIPFIFFILLIMLFGYCIILTGSRKSLIGGGLTIVLWLVLCFFPSLKGKGYLGIVSFFIMFVFIIIIGWEFLSVYRDSTVAQRMGNLFYEASEGKRSEMYREGYELLKQSPLFGMGFQGFAYYYGGYSHATVIEIPVSGGIIGTLLYFSAYYISLIRITDIYKLTRGVKEFASEHIRIKMVFILFVLMCFFSVCIIHPYLFNSSIQFGIIFGETAYLKNRLRVKQEVNVIRKAGSKYIKYE